MLCIVIKTIIEVKMSAKIKVTDTKMQRLGNHTQKKVFLDLQSGCNNFYLLIRHFNYLKDSDIIKATIY